MKVLITGGSTVRMELRPRGIFKSNPNFTTSNKREGSSMELLNGNDTPQTTTGAPEAAQNGRNDEFEQFWKQYPHLSMAEAVERFRRGTEQPTAADLDAEQAERETAAAVLQSISDPTKAAIILTPELMDKAVQGAAALVRIAETLLRYNPAAADEMREEIQMLKALRG